MEDPGADLEHNAATSRVRSDEIDVKRRVAEQPAAGRSCDDVVRGSRSQLLALLAEQFQQPMLGRMHSPLRDSSKKNRITGRQHRRSNLNKISSTEVRHVPRLKLPAAGAKSRHEVHRGSLTDASFAK
jgi:hypothetical protein